MRSSTSCTRRRWILGVTLPVFSYTGTIRPVCTVSPSSSSRISYCGLVSCSPPLPAHLDRPEEHDALARREHVPQERPGSAMSHATDPLSSLSSASKILKPGRRVDRKPQLSTRPAIDAVCPGLSEAIGCRWLRSS